MYYIISIVCLLIAMIFGFLLTLRMNKKIETEENRSKAESTFPNQ